MSETPRQKLQRLLYDLFQFDSADLDFGIYRIMNLRRNELQRFINKDLLDAVARGFEEIRKGESHHILEELAGLKDEIAKTLEIDPEKEIPAAFQNTPVVKRYVSRKAELADVKVSGELEAELFSDIYTFFSRYWDEGDFISHRRYSREAKYAIPYNGEEVMLHWANHDQYYIKTAENFNDYTFKAESYTIHFKIVSAQTEQNNVKGEKRFFILNEAPDNVILGAAEGGAKNLTIRFQYRPLTEQEQITYGKQKQQEKINESVCQKVLGEITDQRLKALLSTVKEGEERSLLAKQLYRYTKKNTTDYFIHKDLKGFLERELDFFIKNEVMMLDAIGTEKEVHFEKYLTKVKVLKQVCLKIIVFLAQLEDFQKRLFEKRKFVLETNYCMTLDNVPEEFYDEILENENQLNAWKELFALPIDAKKKLLLPQEVEEQKAGKRSMKKEQQSLGLKSEAEKLNKTWLKKNLRLVLDTKFFGPEFKDQVLGGLERLDDKLGGLLIESENFQALNLLVEKYECKVKCIYVDPPYNAKSSEILYKNNFKHSSWLSLIENRASLSRVFLNDKGVFVIAIDENEQEKLGLVLDRLFPGRQRTCVTVLHNPSGQQGDNFSYTSEFAYFVYPAAGRSIAEETRDEKSDIRNFRDVTGDESLRESAANCFYAIYVREGQITGFGEVCKGAFHPTSMNIVRSDGTVEVYPIDPQNIERKWRFARGTVESIREELHAHFIKAKGRNVWDIKRTKSNFNFKTVWADSKYSANNHGTQLLNHILGKQLFSYPKSLFTVIDSLMAASGEDTKALVLDYFAGSATTAHAVLALNKADSGQRRDSSVLS